MWVGRVRKSKNFPGSKIFHAKTFRIKRVNRDIFDFATNVRKTCQFHVFLGNLHKIGKKCKEMIIWMDSGISGQSLDFLDNFWIIRIVSGLSGKFLKYPDSLWIIRTVSRLSGQFLNYPDSLLIIRTVPWIVRTVSKISRKSLDCTESI